MKSDQLHVNDHVGSRGEFIFGTIITREHPDQGYLFCRPSHFGEKQRTIDFYVELMRAGERPSHFLAQVKTTKRGYTVRDARLRVSISSAHLRRLARHPAPTYVIGIDERSERGYILSANGERLRGFSSMCTRYPLTSDVLAALHAEVEAYWRNGPADFQSAFVDDQWRLG